MSFNALFLRESEATCPECKLVFDLLNEEQAGAWFYGHDCEVPS
jgi:hypothetical protein